MERDSCVGLSTRCNRFGIAGFGSLRQRTLFFKTIITAHVFRRIMSATPAGSLVPPLTMMGKRSAIKRGMSSTHTLSTGAGGGFVGGPCRRGLRPRHPQANRSRFKPHPSELPGNARRTGVNYLTGASKNAFYWGPAGQKGPRTQGAAA